MDPHTMAPTMVCPRITSTTMARLEHILMHHPCFRFISIAALLHSHSCHQHHHLCTETDRQFIDWCCLTCLSLHCNPQPVYCSHSCHFIHPCCCLWATPDKQLFVTFSVEFLPLFSIANAGSTVPQQSWLIVAFYIRNFFLLLPT